MFKSNTKRTLYLFGLTLLLFIAGCVDTGVQPIPSSIDFRSEVKVVNFAVSMGTASFVLKSTANNGADVALGTLALGEEGPSANSAFENIPSGAKALIVSGSAGSETLNFTADTERKMRMYAVEDDGVMKLIKSVQRYTWQTKDSPNGAGLFPSGSSAVSFINGSPDAQVDGLGFKSSSLDTLVSFSSLKVGGTVGYMQFAAGDYTVNVISGSDTLSTLTTTFGSQKRYTVAVFDNASTLKNTVYIDD